MLKRRNNLGGIANKPGVSLPYVGAVLMLGEWVNFDYGDYRYILDGDASVTLSELLHNLRIAKDEEGTILTAEDVDDVTFSNPALVEVSRKENDWTLTAKRAFDTTEKLTLMLTNGIRFLLQ